MKIVAKNRRATYDYQIEDKLVAGLVLSGAEVKSIKLGHVSLKGSYVAIRNQEAYLTGAQVTPYNYAGGTGHAADRDRKLLLHREQIDELIEHKKGGRTIVPLALGVERGLIKLEIALGKGKKNYDKRETMKRRTQEREADQAVKNRR